MYQFFIEDSRIEGNHAVITGGDVNHIKNVLRMRSGEKIRISTASGRSYYGLVEKIGAEAIEVSLLNEPVPETELPAEIYLFQGLPKADKMEWIIQKAVELGAYEIIPVEMKNCVVRMDEKKAAAKTARWQEIARSAAKQSKRSRIPEVKKPMSYREALETARGLDVFLVPYENAHGMAATKEAVEKIKRGQRIGVLIGPEGGFAPEEIANAKEAGADTISLGSRILRTETAGLATLSVLMYHLEMLG